ncbi:MAG: heavy metal translocating P-type ATPase [Thermomicrobiales bacterium]
MQLTASRQTEQSIDKRETPVWSTTIHWLRGNALAVAALTTWIMTIAGLLLDHVAGIDGPMLILFYAIAYVSGGTLAFRSAIRDLLSRTINVDLLMVTAAIGAATIDAWAEGALLLALFSTSNALEHAALDKTRSAIRSLMTFAPSTAIRIDHEGDHEVHISGLAVGDIVRARPGDRVAVDGRVVTGISDVDQAAITGESIPVEKVPGSETFAGTMNGSGSLTIRVTRLSNESTLARIVRLVEDARESKSRIERATDRLEGPYTIGVIVLSIVAGMFFLLFGDSPSSAYYRAMTVLVVASPCALVIATPAASLSALANAARHGVLIKGGGYLDQLGRVEIVALDKTGTLTTGRPEVVDVVRFGSMDEATLLANVAAVERSSEHPIAEAIVRAADLRELPRLETAAFESITGKGVTGTVNGSRLSLGNERLLSNFGIEVPADVQTTVDDHRSLGRTTMFVEVDGEIVGMIAVADAIRPEAKSMIASLHAAGVRRIVMLTGDNERVAQAVARQTGINEVHAGLLPTEKLDLVRELKTSGMVVMVGDGVNDAPALAMADVGVAMGAAGSDVALETADAVLMGDDLGRLPDVLRLGQRTRRIIRGNLIFAVGIIAVLTLTSLTFGLALPLGVLGHEGSTIIVLLSGLRLLRGSMGSTPSESGETVGRTTAPADLIPQHS